MLIHPPNSTFSGWIAMRQHRYAKPAVSADWARILELSAFGKGISLMVSATCRGCHDWCVGSVRPAACRSDLAPLPPRWLQPGSAARRSPFANWLAEPHNPFVADARRIADPCSRAPLLKA